MHPVIHVTHPSFGHTAAITEQDNKPEHSSPKTADIDQGHFKQAMVQKGGHLFSKKGREQREGNAQIGCKQKKWGHTGEGRPQPDHQAAQ